MTECFSLVPWLLKSKSFAPERLRLGESHAEGTVMARGPYSSTVETHSAGEKQGWCQTDLWQASLFSLGRVVDHTITANKTVKKATTWTCGRWKLSACSNNAGVLPPLVMEDGWVMLQHQAGEGVVIFILIMYHMFMRYMFLEIFIYTFLFRNKRFKQSTKLCITSWGPQEQNIYSFICLFYVTFLSLDQISCTCRHILKYVQFRRNIL